MFETAISKGDGKETTRNHATATIKTASSSNEHDFNMPERFIEERRIELQIRQFRLKIFRLVVITKQQSAFNI